MPEKEGISLDKVDSKTLYGKKGTERKKVVAVNNGKMEEDSVCEVKFCTSGKLSAPEVLHFYDYNMMSAQLISELASKDNYMPLIIKILNSMVVEDFDCGLLHIEEIKEVLLNVYAKWWGPLLHDFPYFLKPELEGDALLDKANISYAEIPIANLKIKPLPSHIAEPINISHNGTTVKFIFPRSQISGITDEAMKVRFAEQEQRFFKTKQMVKAKKTEDVPVAELEEYQEYLAERAEWKLLLTRAQWIYAVNDDVFETLEDQVNALKTNKCISMRHFELYNKFLENEGAFGLQDEVEFYSDVLDQKVKRPFRFRTYNLIPSLDSKRDDENKISFG